MAEIPANQKVQIVANGRERVLMRCQTSEDKEREMKNLDDRLKRNGFSDQEIKTMWRKNRSKKAGEYVSANDDSLSFFFSVPFVSDSVNGKLRKLFKKAGIRVTLVHKGRSLRNMLQKTQTQRRCKIPNCATPSPQCRV